MDDFQKQFEEQEIKEYLTARELIEILKRVDPNSIIKISNWDNHFTIKSTNINNGIVFLNTYKN